MATVQSNTEKTGKFYMSTMKWDGNRIMQQVGRGKEELGYIGFDENTKTWVLWLKDTCGVLGLNGGDIRGDEYASDEEAKDKAMGSPSAFIMHYIWIRRVAKRQVIESIGRTLGRDFV